MSVPFPRFAVGERMGAWGSVVAPLRTPLRPGWLLWNDSEDDLELVRWAGGERLEALETWRSLPADPHRVGLREIAACEPAGWLLRTEFIPAGSLERAAGCHHDPLWPLRIGAELSAALPQLPVHGGLKPSNVLLSAAGLPVWTDWGSAPWAALMSTPDWREQPYARDRMLDLAPEVLAGDAPAAAATPAADIYSFAVLLYRLLAGEPPRRAPNWEEMRRLHAASPVPEVAVEPAPLRELLQCSLAPLPAARPQAWAEVQALLAAALEAAGARPWPAPPSPVLAQRLERVARLGAMGRYELAETALAALVEEAPRWEAVRAQRVSLLRRQGRTEEALTACESWLEQAADPGQVWIEKGRLAQRLGRNRSALDAYDAALALNREDQEAWFCRAVLLEELDRPAEAVAHYEHLLHLNPRHEAAWSNQAGLLAASGMHAEALACLEKALDLAPDSPPLCLNRGILLARAFERWREAVTWLEKAQAAGIVEAGEWLEYCRQRLTE